MNWVSMNWVSKTLFYFMLAMFLQPIRVVVADSITPYTVCKKIVNYYIELDSNRRVKCKVENVGGEYYYQVSIVFSKSDLFLDDALSVYRLITYWEYNTIGTKTKSVSVSVSKQGQYAQSGIKDSFGCIDRRLDVVNYDELKAVGYDEEKYEDDTLYYCFIKNTTFKGTPFLESVFYSLESLAVKDPLAKYKELVKEAKNSQQ